MGTVTELQQIVPEASQEKAINWLIEKIEDDLLAVAVDTSTEVTQELLIGAAAMRGKIINSSLVSLYRDQANPSDDTANNQK